MEHWFWLSLIAGILVWYFLVTLLVGVRGYWNIRDMLKGFEDRQDQPPSGR